MIFKRRLDIRKTFAYVRGELALAAGVSAAVYALYTWGGIPQVALPNILPGVLGTALAIFLGFRNSAAYGRWGEAAQLWASITNYSRVFARLILTFVESHNHTPAYQADAAAAYTREMIYRHLAWVHALRLHLRGQGAWDELRPFLSDADWTTLSTQPNKPLWLLSRQGTRIYDAMRTGTLQGFDSFQLENCLAQLSGYQAQCERIQSIPIPRQYTFFTRLFVWVLIAIVPFSFLQSLAGAGLGWLIVPVSLLLAYVFGIVERTGAVNEEPFANRITDVPLTATCITIERDLRGMLGERDLPAPPQPVNGYLD